MLFSKRTGWILEESVWARAASSAKSRGKVMDLTQSNPTRCGFHYSEKVPQVFSDLSNQFYEPDPRGLLQAREAVSSYYLEKGVPVSPERLLLTAGTSEAYSFLFKLLADPGKTVLVPEPGYPLLDHLAQLSDVQIIRYPLTYNANHGWSIDRERFLKLLGPDVRALVVVHPNNPTGHWTSDDERQWLERQAAEHHFALIADEVFLDYPFNPTLRPDTFARSDTALTFTLSGVSKICGLPQMKLSWIAASGPTALAEDALGRLAVIADAYLSVAGLSQRALPALLSLRAETIAEIGGRVRENRGILERALSGRVLRADAGWYGILRFDRKETDEAVSLELMGKGVLAQPGYLFDLPEHHLVLSLLPESTIFNEGVRRLADLV